MKHILLVAFASVFLGQSLYSEEIKDFGRDRLNSSPRHGEWVDIKSGDRTIKAFVVYPESKNKTPVVLVISEIFGLTDWVRSVCDELAENGVIAIAPDLHGGQKFEDLDGARKATSALPKATSSAWFNSASSATISSDGCVARSITAWVENCMVPTKTGRPRSPWAMSSPVSRW